MLRWLILLFLIVRLPVTGKESNGYQARIDNLPCLPKSVMVDSVIAIITDLVLESKAVNLHYSEKMLQLKDALTAESYLTILSHLAETVERENQALLDHSISFALENGLHQYLGSLYLLKTRFFRQEGMYDSAMIYTLRARENIEKYYNVEDEANMLHLLGDLYYSTGLYDIARDYYFMANEVKGTHAEWNSWRRRVIRNNLAQIEMKKGNHYLALIMFQESLTELGSSLTSKNDSLAAAYILLMMAENYLQLDNLEKAETFTETTKVIYKQMNDPQGIYRSYMLKTKLAVGKKDILKAGSYLDSAIVYSNKTMINPEERAGFFWQQSKLYELQNKPYLALEKFKQFAALRDSLNNGLSAARIQQIQAGNEFASLDLQNMNLRKQRSLHLALLVTAFVSVIIVVLHNFNIRQKNRKLVALSINGVKRKSKIKRDEKALKSERPQEEFDPKMAELIAGFSELMNSRKLYLDVTISLEKVAQELGTNRSYLSKAINQEMNQGFSTVINTLRIKEAISIISQSEKGKISISELAEKTGFNSRTVFIAAFSKHTGMLPSSFISNYKSLYKSATPPKFESE